MCVDYNIYLIRSDSTLPARDQNEDEKKKVSYLFNYRDKFPPAYL